MDGAHVGATGWAADMTQTTNDEALAFVELLDPTIRAAVASPNRPHPSGLTSAAAYYIHVAIDQHGWTVQQLAADCTRNLDDVVNPAGLLTYRLSIAATIAPPAPRPDPKRALPHLEKTHASCCEDGWIYDETTDPPSVTKCHGVKA